MQAVSQVPTLVSDAQFWCTWNAAVGTPQRSFNLRFRLELSRSCRRVHSTHAREPHDLFLHVQVRECERIVVVRVSKP